MQYIFSHSFSFSFSRFIICSILCHWTLKVLCFYFVLCLIFFFIFYFLSFTSLDLLSFKFSFFSFLHPCFQCIRFRTHHNSYLFQFISHPPIISNSASHLPLFPVKYRLQIGDENHSLLQIWHQEENN